MDRYYKRSYSRFESKPRAPERCCVPQDCACQLAKTRRQLGLTQAQLAGQIGAANKAVVYQWESGKRKPSPVFWKRIEELAVERDPRQILQDRLSGGDATGHEGPLKVRNADLHHRKRTGRHEDRCRKSPTDEDAAIAMKRLRDSFREDDDPCL